MRQLTILVLLLLLIAAPAAAGNTVTLSATVTSSNQYITADGVDSAYITVTVKDSDGTVIKDADVSLGVPGTWGFKDSEGKTKNDGTFVTTFLPTRVSGNATITARVTGTTSSGVLTTSASYKQVIVGADPQTALSFYQSSATVGSITGITILVKDKNGNPVSSLKKKNEVVFSTNLLDDSGFNSSSGKVKGVSVPLNSSGFAEVNFATSTKPGNNYIIVSPPSPVPQSLINIQGISNAIPASITQVVTPDGNPPTLTTGDIASFVIDYRLYDQWGNPSAGQDVAITVNTGETMTIRSNTDGNVTISFGPKKNAGLFTITAQAVKNPAVVRSQTLQFVSGVPKNMILTASPQSLASLDVKRESYALVLAKVIDSQGNPVPGQTVYFSIRNVTTSYIQTRDPSVSGDGGRSTSGTTEVAAVTDGSGYAIGTFTPGTFTTDEKNPKYSLMADAVARVRARWGSINNTIDISYKNYPYLSVLTTVDPMTVVTNKTVKLTIRVKGDGYALKPKPVDVYLVTDRSGSMASGNPSRMTLVKNASSTFKNSFDYSVDRIGQYSFGGITGSFKDYATPDQKLTNLPNKIDTAISSLSPSGNTPMRYALYQAITELKNNANSGSVKALVILSDGDYNDYGDPLARGSPGQDCGWTWQGKYVCTLWDPTGWEYGDGTRYYYVFPDLPSSEQNLAQYAKDYGIRIYAIGFTEDLSPDGRETLRTLAESTGGFYRLALTQADLLNFYGQIAGALKDTAGVETSLGLDFTSVDLNGVPVSGLSTLQYQYIDGISTKITRPNGTILIVNSTTDWNAGRFNIPMGTIKVNQSWVMDLTLKALQPGNIKLVGGSSKVRFLDLNGINEEVPLPDTFITSIPEGEKGLTTPKLTLSGLSVVVSEDRTTAYLAWDILYENGRDPEIDELIEVGYENSDIFPYVWSKNVSSAAAYDKAALDVTGLPNGVYTVRVTGYVFDAGSDDTMAQMKLDGRPEKAYIKIQ